MARPESIAKAGYYPTPPSVVERVAALIRPASHSPRQSVRLLDPCCGTGAALRRLADATGGETYGIEIAGDRAEQAQAVLDHVIGGSAFAVRLAHGAFSCLWLNPPYDHDDEAKRLEHAFLTEMTRALRPGGLLVFIVPQRRLAVSARYLAGHFMRLTCYRFPDPEYEGFQQIVLLAVKRDGAVGKTDEQPQLEAGLWRRYLGCLRRSARGGRFTTYLTCPPDRSSSLHSSSIRKSRPRRRVAPACG